MPSSGSVAASMTRRSKSAFDQSLPLADAPVLYSGVQEVLDGRVVHLPTGTEHPGYLLFTTSVRNVAKSGVGAHSTPSALLMLTQVASTQPLCPPSAL